MIFSVAKAVSYLSQGTTLMPGDLIFMGTPAGVAMGRNPPEWLKDGDVVQVFVDMVGSCTNAIRFYHPGRDATGHNKTEKRPEAETGTETRESTTAGEEA
ncbi:hypothetical protein MFIFM68171_01043 [Madurella fahalii]|uniref:Fumarylacetoacetase-like C-terminal domain-containing protein n=1 Tax=Madurella fahalii TaxID=1157608 RepID=A0ABQ0FZC7_9PEZI